MTVATTSPKKTNTVSRKRRTRKVTKTATTSSPKLNKTTAKVVVEDIKVVENVRPEKPNLSLKDYQNDIKVRWEIHSWEVKELWKDVVKGYNNSKPFVVKSYNYVKDSYNSHFNPSN